MTERAGWRVPGHVGEELLDIGPCGELWRGRVLASGEPVALHRLRPADERARNAVRHVAAQPAAHDHPHLLRIRDAIVTPTETVLVVDHARGGSLAALLGRRDRLGPGEVVTILAPVAAALAHAHRHGEVHGHVTPASILFTEDGRPLLAGLGLGPVLRMSEPGPGGRADADQTASDDALSDPASDVFAVATVAVHALTGRPLVPAESVTSGARDRVARWEVSLALLAPNTPRALVHVLERALSPSPDERCSAADLARDVRRACPPEPIQLMLAVHPGSTTDRVPRLAADPPQAFSSHPHGTGVRGRQPRGPGRHRREVRRSAFTRRRRGSAVFLTLLLGAASGVGPWLVVGRSGGAGQSKSPAHLSAATAETSADVPLGPSSERPTASWLRVLDGLDRTRAVAYERGDLALLRRVYVPGEHLDRDTAQLRRLLDSGVRASGVRHQIELLNVVGTTARGVRLRISQRLTPSVRMFEGRPVGRFPGTRPTEIIVELAATAGGWRLT